MTNELHVFLDIAPEYCYFTFTETFKAIERGDNIVNTTQPHFLHFYNAHRIFVHVNEEVHEITLGECEGTNREIREAHNLEKMLIAGEFDWFYKRGLVENV